MSKSLCLFVALAACGSSPPPVATTPHATEVSIVDPAIPLLARRAEMIQRLHDYRVAQIYPADAVGRPASVFRDASGRLCPMASLIDQSGGHAIVDWVATHDNALRLASVHEGPVMDWIASSGLTQEEITTVQGVMAFEPREIQQMRTITAARTAITRRLEAAERMLRDGTATSMPTVAARYKARRDAVATMPAVEHLAFSPRLTPAQQVAIDLARPRPATQPVVVGVTP